MVTYEEFAALFGLNLDERFKVRDTETDLLFEPDYMFTSEGFFEIQNDEETSVDFDEAKFISGAWEIVKGAWKPQVADVYYCINSYGTGVNKVIWDNTLKNLEDFYCSNCFRSEKEALEGRTTLLTTLEEYYNNPS